MAIVINILTLGNLVLDKLVLISNALVVNNLVGDNFGLVLNLIINKKQGRRNLIRLSISIIGLNTDLHSFPLSLYSIPGYIIGRCRLLCSRPEYPLPPVRPLKVDRHKLIRFL